jgi:hypothetical protein
LCAGGSGGAIVGDEQFHSLLDAHFIAGILRPFHVARDFDCAVGRVRLSAVTLMVPDTPDFF